MLIEASERKISFGAEWVGGTGESCELISFLLPILLSYHPSIPFAPRPFRPFRPCFFSFRSLNPQFFVYASRAEQEPAKWHSHVFSDVILEVTKYSKYGVPKPVFLHSRSVVLGLPLSNSTSNPGMVDTLEDRTGDEGFLFQDSFNLAMRANIGNAVVR